MWPFKPTATSAPEPRSEPRAQVAPVRASLNAPQFLGSLSDAGITDFFRGTDAGSFGPSVSETNSMRISTVFACVELIASLVSSAPLSVLHDSATKGRQIATSNALHRKLSLQPYPGRAMTSSTWRALWVRHVLLWGNHYSRIRFDGANRVVGFEVLDPWSVRVLRQDDGTNLYVQDLGDGKREVLRQNEILHFSGPSFDGLVGVSRITQFARDPAALAMVLEEQTGRMHENAARPSGVLEMPSSITPEGFKRMRSDVERRSTGRANAGNMMFVDSGTKYTAVDLMSLEDLNTLETRRFQAAELCRFFGVPPHLIGEAANTSAWGSGIEQLTLGFKQFTLHPLLVDFEQELTLKLFASTNEYFPQFDRASLVVMDAQTQALVAQTEIQTGVLSIDERRRQLSRPAYNLPGTDEPLVNSTMLPLSRIVEGATAPNKDASNVS